MFLYRIKIHGYKRPFNEWFDEPLEIGHTYAGSAGVRSHCLFDVIALVDALRN